MNVHKSLSVVPSAVSVHKSPLSVNVIIQKCSPLRNNAETMDIRERLREFELSGVRETGRELGRGAYGVVVEVEVNGLRCAAKKLHAILLETNHEERVGIIGRFVEECFQHSRQRHPNIVQLLGVHFPSPKADLPLMVIEMMEMSLSACVEKHPGLPLALKNEILVDIAQGLLHLHSQSPPIIHRDLTANNALLTRHLTAKIADLGVARIVNVSPSLLSSQMTKQPGTVAYMPPEALRSKPSYNTKLDVFSFGVLILHVFTDKWPLPSAEFMPLPDSAGVYQRVLEIDRRTEYLRELGKEHTHMQLVSSCLHNKPEVRPTASEVLDSLRAITREIGCYPNRLELVYREGGLELR